MSDRRALVLLVLTMIVTVLISAALALGLLYESEITRYQARLAAVARSIAQALGGSADGLATPGWLTELALPIAGQFLAEDGRILIGRQEPGAASIATYPALAGASPAVEGPSPAEAAVVMQRALAGEAGVTTFYDQRGNGWITAFEPARAFRGGVLAILPLASIRAPFVEAARQAAIAGVPLLLGASALVFFLLRPILRRSRDRQARLSGIMQHTRTGVILLRIDADGDFTVSDLNRAAEEIEGLRRTEVLDQRIAEVLLDADTSGLLDALRRVARTGAAQDLTAAPCQQGSVWRETHLCRLPTGEIALLQHDVSDRKRAEDAWRESEGRWRSIIELHNQAVLIIDHAHAIRFANRAAESLFGKPAHELVGMPFGMPLAQGEVAEIEVLRPHHGVAFTEMRVIPMRAQGEEHFLLLLRDMSAYKRAEGDLRKLFQAIEQSPAAVVITDIEGRIEYVNPKFTETSGYTYAEVVGKNPRILKSGHTSPEEYHALWKTITSGQVWHGEFYNRHKTGAFFWELVAIAPVRDARGAITHYVAVKEDISERKATEERLRHSQKMETIGQLTGGLAHDFNNLLAIIIGNLQLLEEKEGMDGESRDLVADALWSAERGAQLTHRLLAFARRQRLNPKLTDLNRVVGEMTDLLRRTIGESIRIDEAFEPHLWKTMVDRSQLENSLLNLVVNARDAMPSGGVLQITTANAAAPPPADAVDEEAPAGECVLLTVSDSGAGMSPEVLERIFEPFFTTKKLGEGSGLGLSMVYGFVRQSGGQIFVDSEPGAGTTVRLYLPRAMGEAAEEASRQRSADGPMAGGQVIMVVEDEGRVRKTATAILRKQGYDVVEAADAAAALVLAGSLTRLDLLFTDIALPDGRNGVELAEEVLKLRPGTRVLFTSGYAADALFSKSRLGAIDLLAKPYRRDELTLRVRALLERAGADTAAPSTAGVAQGSQESPKAAAPASPGPVDALHADGATPASDGAAT